jgi:hypothetical protein
MDRRLRDRFFQLVAEHEHVLTEVTSGLSALPGTAKPFASTQAMWRFLANDSVTLSALIEPIQDAARATLLDNPQPIALIMHDWCMLNFSTHTSKTDRFQRTHKTDLGYELATSFLVEADRGTPLGPMELRLRTAKAVVSTRLGDTPVHSARLDELVGAMEASQTWKLGRTPIHIIDREADSVWHYRQWNALGHLFVVRADDDRWVRRNGLPRRLPEVAEDLQLEGAFTEMNKAIDYKGTKAWLRKAETQVVLDRPAKRKINGKKKDIPGEAISLRLIVCLVVDDTGKVLGRWLLLSNVSAKFTAATVVTWYYWRWRIENYHKLLKSAGQQVEQWEQESGQAIAKRLVIASMACLTVWILQQDPSPQAGELRRILVRLSGRQMKHKVESTAPALLAGLEKLLAMLDLVRDYDIAQLRNLLNTALPTLFNSS